MTSSNVIVIDHQNDMDVLQAFKKVVTACEFSLLLHNKDPILIYQNNGGNEYYIFNPSRFRKHTLERITSLPDLLVAVRATFHITHFPSKIKLCGLSIMKLKAKPKSTEIVNFIEPVRVDMVDDGVIHESACTRTSFCGTVENHSDTVNHEETVVGRFKKNVSVGPVFVCACCYQTWFKESVREVDETAVLNLPAKLKHCVHNITSFNDKRWICYSCFKSIKNDKMPRFALSNGMGFPVKPRELDISQMEERLISPRIPFMQIIEKPRGGQRSLKGNIVNVPTDVESTVKCLPRNLNDSETIQIKLKRKLNYKHCVMHETVRPNKCIVALKWLLRNSTLFQSENIRIKDDWSLSGLDEFYGLDSDCENPASNISRNTSTGNVGNILKVNQNTSNLSSIELNENNSSANQLQRQKGGDLTQSYDKSPYTNRNVKGAK